METTDNWFDKLLMKKRFYIIITLLFVGIFAISLNGSILFIGLIMNMLLTMNF